MRMQSSAELMSVVAFTVLSSTAAVWAQASAPTTNYTQQGETMSGAPALASINNTMYVAFKANDSSNRLFFDTSSDGVNLKGAQVVYANDTGYPNPAITMGSDPAIVAFGGALYTAFKSATSDYLFICQTQFGVQGYSGPNGFTSCRQQSYGMIGAPSLTVYNNRLYVALKADSNEASPSDRLLIASAPIPSGTSGNGLTFPSFDKQNVFTTLVGGPPAIAGYNNQIYVAFQAHDSSHSLFLQTFALDLSSFGPAYQYATTIGPTPALTVTGPKTNTMMIAFEANDSQQHLWFEPYYGSMLQPAVQNNAQIGGAPAELDWTPTSGQYAGTEIITSGFRSYNSTHNLWLGSQPVH